MYFDLFLNRSGDTLLAIPDDGDLHCPSFLTTDNANRGCYTTATCGKRAYVSPLKLNVINVPTDLSGFLIGFGN